MANPKKNSKPAAGAAGSDFIRRDATLAGLKAALGLVPFAKRGMNEQQTAAVRVLTARADFPPLVKGQWSRPAVGQWSSAHLQLIKRGGLAREFKVVDVSKLKIESAANPPPPAATDAAADVSDEEFARRELIIAKLPAPYQSRYRELLQMHDHPNPLEGGKTLTEKQYQDLIDIGLVQRGGELLGKTVGGKEFRGKPAPVVIPDYCSQGELADILSELFNSIVYPMMVSNAINKEGMPGRQRNQSIKTSLAIPWWEKHKVQTDQQGSLFQESKEAEMRTKLHEERLAKMKADEAERSVSDKYMETVTVLGFIGGFAHWLGLQQDKFIEDRPGVRKIVAECVTTMFKPTVEQLAALDVQLTAQLAAANSAMKTATAHRVTELVNDLTDKRKQEIQENKQS